MIRSLRPGQLAFDIALAVFCLLLRALLGPEAAILVVTLFMATALAMRRLAPGIALVIAWLGALVQMAAVLPPDVANLAILAVLFTAARYGTPLVRWLGLASAVLGSVVATGYFILMGFVAVGVGSDQSIFVTMPQFALALTFSLGASLAVLGLSWTAGLLARTWATARDSRQRQASAEREVVVEQERNRIARDMHDVVAHSLAVVIAQADGARYARESDPAAVDGALTTIATTAREALADVRLLLGQLRHDHGAGPQPVLADLDSLIAQLRASGLDIHHVRSGQNQVLPASHQLAVYRIVQEALTNALRHGDAAASVSVRLTQTDAELEVVVSSRMRPGPAIELAEGHGITGMRERALLVGGVLTAGAVGERFVVAAVIPVRAAVSA